MYAFVWRKAPRARWTLSGKPSNHRRLVRILKHPDISVSQAGRCIEPLSDSGETTFSLEEFAFRGQPDNQTSKSFASSKTVFPHMGYEPENSKELANEENKQFNPGGRRGEPPL